MCALDLIHPDDLANPANSDPIHQPGETNPVDM
jgi:hypothetical protein